MVVIHCEVRSLSDGSCLSQNDQLSPMAQGPQKNTSRGRDGEEGSSEEEVALIQTLLCCTRIPNGLPR